MGTGATSTVMYLLWSNKHRAWWRPNAAGYTDDVTEAGRFTETEAVHYVVASADHGKVSQVTCMVTDHPNVA